MGNKQSAQTNVALTPQRPAENAPFVTPSPTLRIDRRGCEGLLLDEALVDALLPSLPPTCQSSWRLLYSSNNHGKNFTQLVRRIEDRGPTLIIVKEAGGSGRCFGGYSDAPWLTVAQRDHRGRVSAAAQARSDRLHTSDRGVMTKPERQAKQFSGTSDCFVFTSGDRDADTNKNNVRVFRPKTGAASNANYMYLFDHHPQSERVGIGMGSDSATGPGEFAWFLDRYLAHGRCSVRLCPTFGNPRLSSETEFDVGSVEAYALDPDSQTWDDDGNDDDGALGNRHAVDKALLELHGQKFYSDENRDEC